MIVDDDAQFLEELQETLALNGYQAIAVSDCRRVLDTAAAAQPDVILLDLKMRQPDGFQLADALRRLAPTGAIPVIAMTGVFTEAEHLSLLGICGIRRCITKPFEVAELVRAIEAAAESDTGRFL
jgi:DNA-binding response OmpR family regulator